ncbi:OsmC family protein [Streptomyces albus]|uniref:OsmC family protein n=1 Tax=Streptomyces albus (strain ATCC 21838 / DSM 41398 / FERM P-419 / JCM 4703 / NBRC 107858) TaxID=1081613 RepID=A0A0B5EI77_STRA4|nr:OsmC family protein [Streptomyces albus]AOU76209.1 OsmC family protein [Streptomyces albus]AYN31999.1 peroxiredoxin [Streptomyces albus]
MTATHAYDVTVAWTGNLGPGTSTYRSFSRDHDVRAEGKPPLAGSSDPAFRGDTARWNPEELLVASLAQCHMLWYLHLCATNGVVVTDYADRAHGEMALDASGGGQFTGVTLRPEVAVADASMLEKGHRLHAEVPALCFIARSVNFPVTHVPVLRVEKD